MLQFEEQCEELKELTGARVIGFVENEDTFGLWLDRLGKRFYVWFYQDGECNGPGSFIIEEEDPNVEVDDVGVGS